MGTQETLKPFAEHYASRGEPDFTADRIQAGPLAGEGDTLPWPKVMVR